MSQPDNGNGNGRGVKTLAIRLEPELHAQLSLIAQMRGNTITDEIRAALETHIESVKNAPELAAQAGNVLEAIEAEATARREAISTLFGNQPNQETSASRSRGNKAATSGGSGTS
jgi:predicted DNA-binding protein